MRAVKILWKTDELITTFLIPFHSMKYCFFSTVVLSMKFQGLCEILRTHFALY